MANSALIRGARDVARAKFIDPYKFSAWIRSMWYGLDKLDDRRYAERMANLSSAAKIQENKRKQIDAINKLHIKDLDKHTAAFAGVIKGMFPEDKKDLQSWFDTLEQNYRMNMQIKNQSSPQSKEWSVANQNQQQIIEDLNTISNQYKEYLEHYGQLYPALRNQELSGNEFRNTVVYHNIVDPQHRRMGIIKNEKGASALGMFFDNPYEGATNFLPPFDVDEEGNVRYGIIWGDYKAKYGNFNLKNKGKGNDINVVYEDFRQKTIKGNEEESGMYQRDPLTNELKIATPEQFLARGITAYDKIISTPSLIQSGPNKGDEYNTDAYTNAQALANDLDIDGAGGTMTEFKHSTQALAIQPYYMQWLATQPNHPAHGNRWSAYGKGIKTKKQFYQHMENAPYWINDREFAEGYIELPNIDGESIYDIDLNGLDNPDNPETLGGKVVSRPKGFEAGLTKEFAGRDLLQNALALYYAEGTYDALAADKGPAERYLAIKNAKDIERAGPDEVFKVKTQDETYMTALQQVHNLGSKYKRTYSTFVSGDIGLETLDNNMLTSLVGDLRTLTGKSNLRTAKNAWLTYAGLLASGENKKLKDLTSDDLVEGGLTDEWKAYVDQSEEVKKALKADVNYTVPKKPLAFKNWIENKNLNWKKAKNGILQIVDKKAGIYNLIDLSKIQPLLDQAKRGNVTEQALRDALDGIMEIKKGIGGSLPHQTDLLSSEKFKSFIRDTLKLNK